MIKLVFKQRPKDEKGNIYNNYYLQTENGMLIPIRPSFSEDYKKLRVLAVEIDNN